MRTSRCKVCERRRPVARMERLHEWEVFTAKGALWRCVDRESCAGAYHRAYVADMRRQHGCHWYAALEVARESDTW